MYHISYHFLELIRIWRVKMKKTQRIVISLPKYLKGKLEELAQKYECSQAEVLRYALLKLAEAEECR